jgi:hypothetical protein
MQTAFTLPMQSFRLKEIKVSVALSATSASAGAWLGLRVADSLGEHLAKLGLRLRRLAREGSLPLGHPYYVGMLEAELNPPADNPGPLLPS